MWGISAAFCFNGVISCFTCVREKKVSSMRTRRGLIVHQGKLVWKWVVALEKSLSSYSCWNSIIVLSSDQYSTLMLCLKSQLLHLKGPFSTVVINSKITSSVYFVFQIKRCTHTFEVMNSFLSWKWNLSLTYKKKKENQTSHESDTFVSGEKALKLMFLMLQFWWRKNKAGWSFQAQRTAKKKRNARAGPYCLCFIWFNHVRWIMPLIAPQTT